MIIFGMNLTLTEIILIAVIILVSIYFSFLARRLTYDLTKENKKLKKENESLKKEIYDMKR